MCVRVTLLDTKEGLQEFKMCLERDLHQHRAATKSEQQPMGGACQNVYHLPVQSLAKCVCEGKKNILEIHQASFD
jgi:hypothetical protein